MVDLCPTVTAFDREEYSRQLRRVTPFAKRIHIDLMDGTFAPSVSPHLGEIWLPHGPKVDIHLMYQEPMKVLPELIKLRPHMVVIHNEAHVHHMHFAAELHKHGIKAGLAVLQDTPIDYTYQIMHSFDHVLVFSGHLGYHGGHADLHLLEKVIGARKHYPEIEIGWDGGITDENLADFIAGGVEVLNIGGYIQKASDPEAAYAKLLSIARGSKSER